MSLPDKCLACPQVLARLDHIKEHRTTAKKTLDGAFTDDIDAAAAIIASSEQADQLGLAGMSVEEVAAFLRQQASTSVEAESAVADDHELELSRFAAHCLGPVRLRGSRDGRRVYVATICASPSMTDSPYENVSVERHKMSRDDVY